MTLRLRAHHLLCVLTYIGRGYSPAFTANYDGIIRRLNAGEDVLVIDGPDEICRPLLNEQAKPHCHAASVRKRDVQAARTLSQWLARPIAPGRQIRPDENLLSEMRTAFAKGKTRQACTGCEWQSLCTRIAGNGYSESKLKPPRKFHP